MATQTELRAWPILIGGEFRRARSGATLDATNPATGEVIGSFPRCEAQDVDDAVAAALEAFP
ncbi:MAG: aldehyde dehydrogenase family protein, partial [Solirubrobacteraceae bacterium]